MADLCWVSTNHCPFFCVLWTERHHVLKSWLEFSQAPSSDAFVAALTVGSEMVGLERPASHPGAGGWL